MLSENSQHFCHSKLSSFEYIIFLAADVGVKQSFTPYTLAITDPFSMVAKRLLLKTRETFGDANE